MVQNLLGLTHMGSEAVQPDYEQAALWFAKSAEQGNPDGQHNIGYCFMNAHGVPLSYVQAYKWFELAAQSGDEDSKARLRELDNKLSQDQIAEARKLAEEWLEKHKEIQP